MLSSSMASFVAATLRTTGDRRIGVEAFEPFEIGAGAARDGARHHDQWSTTPPKPRAATASEIVFTIETAFSRALALAARSR